MNFEEAVLLLKKSVRAFKELQKRYYPQIEKNDNGEWVFGVKFNKMCSAYLTIIEGYKQRL